jgi:hypothetical protein
MSVELTYHTPHRKGELTRGMIVVDRRASAKKERGRIRSVHHGKKVAAADPVPVEVDSQEESDKAVHMPGEQGIEVVIRTPGSENLMKTLLRRVWGVESTL